MLFDGWARRLGLGFWRMRVCPLRGMRMLSSLPRAGGSRAGSGLGAAPTSQPWAAPWALLGLYAAGNPRNSTAECRYLSLRDLRIFLYDLICRQNAYSLKFSLWAAMALKFFETSCICRDSPGECLWGTWAIYVNLPLVRFGICYSINWFPA